MNRRVLTVVLTLLMLTSSLPTATAQSVPDPTDTRGLQNALLGLSAQVLHLVSQVEGSTQTTGEQGTRAANQALNPNVTIFRDDADHGLGRWHEVVLPGDTAPDTATTWQTSDRSDQGNASFRFGTAGAATYPTGVDRALVSPPIDLRGTLNSTFLGTGAENGYGALRNGSGAGTDAAASFYDRCFTLGSACKILGSTGDMAGGSPLPSGGNVTLSTGVSYPTVSVTGYPDPTKVGFASGPGGRTNVAGASAGSSQRRGQVVLSFRTLYNFSQSTADGGLYYDGGRVEVRALGGNGTWGAWRPVYPTVVTQDLAAASTPPRTNPFEQDPDLPLVGDPLAPRSVDASGAGTVCVVGSGPRCFGIHLGTFSSPLTVNASDPYHTGGGNLGDSPRFLGESNICLIVCPTPGPTAYDGRVLGFGGGWGFTALSDANRFGFQTGSALWQTEQLTLDRYAGQIIEVRFHAVTGLAPYARGDGWYVDDINVTGNVLPDDVGVHAVLRPNHREVVPAGSTLPLQAVVEDYGYRSEAGVTATATIVADGVGSAPGSPCAFPSATPAYNATIPVGDLQSQQRRSIAFPAFHVPDVQGATYHLTVTARLPPGSPGNGSTPGFSDVRNATRTDGNCRNDANPVPVTIVGRTIHNVTVDNLTLAPRVSALDAPKGLEVRLQNRGNVPETARVRAVAVAVNGTGAPALLLDRNLTLPASHRWTSFGALDTNATLDASWHPPRAGIYRLVLDVTTASGLHLHRAMATYVQATPSAYLHEGFNVPVVATPNDVVRGNATTWDASVVPFTDHPHPYRGSHVWAPSLADGTPQAEASTGSSASPGAGSCPVPQTLPVVGYFGPWATLVYGPACNLVWVNVEKVLGHQDVKAPPDGTRTTGDAGTYVLARTLDLRDVSRGTTVQLQIHDWSVMGTGTTAPHGSILVSTGGRLPAPGAEESNVTASTGDSILLADAANATVVRNFTGSFPWRLDTVDLSRYAGSIVDVYLRYDASTNPNDRAPQRWLVDDVTLVENGLPMAIYGGESNGTNGWSSYGWSRVAYRQPDASLWHLDQEGGAPSQASTPFQGGLRWGLSYTYTAQARTCNGYGGGNYSVVRSPPIDLTNANHPVLRFDTRYLFSTDYKDGGNVRVSTLLPNGSWSRPQLVGNASVYGGNLTRNARGDEPGGTLPAAWGSSTVAFTGASGANPGDPAWRSVAMDLSRYRGETVRLEFDAVAVRRASSACAVPSVNWAGWSVDNVRVEEQRFAHDLAADALVQPSPGDAANWVLGPGTTTPVRVRIQNRGIFPVHDGGVEVRVLPIEQGVPDPAHPVFESTATLPATDPVTGQPLSLAANATYTLDLPRPWTTPDVSGATYLVQVRTFLLRNGTAVGDDDAVDDVWSHLVTVQPVHDVALQNLTVTPLVASTSPRSISLEVRNLGNMDERYLQDPAAFQVDVTVTDPQGHVLDLGSKPVGELGPGGTWTPTHAWTWVPQDPVDYIVRAHVTLANDTVAADDDGQVAVRVLNRILTDHAGSGDALATPDAAWNSTTTTVPGLGTGVSTWRFGDGATYPDDANASLTLRSVNLGPANDAILSFHQRVDLEDGYDGGVVEACTGTCNASSTWHRLVPEVATSPLTSASPLVRNLDTWAQDPTSSEAFTGTRDWGTVLVDLGKQSFLTQHFQVFNDSLRGLHAQDGAVASDGSAGDAGAWTVRNATVVPHTGGQMWFATGDRSTLDLKLYYDKATHRYTATKPPKGHENTTAPLWPVQEIHETLHLTGLNLSKVTPGAYSRYAFVSFWDHRVLGDDRIGVEVSAGRGDARVTESTNMVATRAPSDAYRGWTENRLPIDLDTFGGRSNVTITWTLVLPVEGSGVKTPNVGWALDDVSVYALRLDGHRDSIYPGGAGSDGLDYPGTTPAERMANASALAGAHWVRGPVEGVTSTGHRYDFPVNGTAYPPRPHRVPGWVLSGPLAMPGWHPDAAGGWTVGGQEVPGNVQSRLTTPLDLSSVTNAVHLRVRSSWDMEAYQGGVQHQALSGGLVMVSVTPPGPDGSGARWVPLEPDPSLSTGPEPFPVSEGTATPFGRDPQGNSPLGTAGAIPALLSGSTDGNVVSEVYDLTPYRGHQVWLSFVAFTTCSGRDPMTEQNLWTCRANGNALDSTKQTWHLDDVSVDGDVLTAGNLTLRLRAVTDANGHDGSWSVTNLTVLGSYRSVGASVRILAPTFDHPMVPITRLPAADRSDASRLAHRPVAPGTSLPVKVLVRNTGLAPLDLQVRLTAPLVNVTDGSGGSSQVQLKLPGASGGALEGTVHLAPGEERVLTSLGGHPLQVTVPATTARTELPLRAVGTLVGRSANLVEQVKDDDSDQVQVPVNADNATLVAVSASPDDVTLQGAGATVTVAANLQNIATVDRPLLDANVTLLNEKGHRVGATLPLSFAEPQVRSLAPYANRTIRWRVPLAADLPVGNYTVEVLAAMGSGASVTRMNASALLTVEHRNATFFSRNLFHPPGDKNMTGSGWKRDQATAYNYSTYYFDNPRKDRAGWHASVPPGGSSNQPGQLMELDSPWISTDHLAEGFLGLYQRYDLPSAGSSDGAAGLVAVQLCFKKDVSQCGGGGGGVKGGGGGNAWQVIAPVGGYSGTLRSSGIATRGQTPSGPHNPLSTKFKVGDNDYCRQNTATGVRSCPAFTGTTPNFAVDPQQRDAWTPVLFNLSQVRDLLPGALKAWGAHVRFGFFLGTSNLEPRTTDWAVDYITLGPQRFLLGPDQTYSLADGANKTFRYRITNAGQFTDAAQVGVQGASLPTGWNVTILGPDGAPLTDGRGQPLRNLTMAPHTTRELVVRVTTPIARTFASTRDLVLTATSRTDPSRVAEAALHLDFHPRRWPDLLVTPAGVSVDAQHVSTGVPVAVHVEVRNVGDAIARNVPVTVVDVPQYGKPQTLAGPDGEAPAPIPVLAPGASTTVTFRWSPREPGNHTLQVQVDPLGTLTQYSRDNDRVDLPVHVGAEGLPDLALTVEATNDTGADVANGSIPVGHPLHLHVVVRNHGDAPAVDTRLTLLANSFSLLPQLPTVLTGKIAPGAARELNLTWRPQIPGSYLLFGQAFSDFNVAPERTGLNLATGRNYTDDNLWRTGLVVQRPGLALEAEGPAGPVTPGSTVALSATVRNHGSAADTYALALDAPAAWRAVFDASGTDRTLVDVPAGGNVTLVYLLHLPANVTAGSHAFGVLAASRNTSRTADVSLALTVPATGGPRLEAPDLTAVPGTLTVVLNATNEGNAGGRWNLTADLPQGWELAGPDEVRLSPFASTSLVLHLRVPTWASPGEHEVPLGLVGADASTVLHVHLLPRADLALADGLRSVPYVAGIQRNVTLPVRNSGNLPLEVDLAAANATPGVGASLAAQHLTLAPGEVRNVTLQLLVAEPAGNASLTLHAAGARGSWSRVLPLRQVPVDLQVVNVTQEPRFDLHAGANVTLAGEVHNAGVLPMADVAVALFVDGHLQAYRVLPVVPANGTLAVPLSWHATEGRHDAWFVVDPYHRVGESDESNDAVVHTLQVGPPAGLLGRLKSATQGPLHQVPGPGPVDLLVALATALALLELRRRRR